MAKQSRIHQLNEQLDLILSDPNAFPVSTDSELSPLLQIAADLRHMPSDSFKSQLKMRLAHQAKRMSESSSPEQYQPPKGKSMTPETIAVTPYLVVKNAAQAIEFYKKALGASELFRLQEPDGRIGHAELKIGDAPIMLADEYPEYGILGPQTTGQSPVSIHLYVEDADTFAERAIDAGARVLMPVQDQFYGDRAGKIQDPFGHIWHISAHLEDVSPAEMQRRFDEIIQGTDEGKSLEPDRPVPFIPKGMRSVTPYFHPKGADRLIEFLKQAFDAQELGRAISPDGVILHATVRIGDSVIEMGEAHGEFQPMPSAIHLYVPNADAFYRKALEAGATSLRQPANMFYGDREASVKDPFGNYWYIATHISDVHGEEMPETKVSPIPEGYQSVTPYLAVRKAEELLDFVKNAFGATETFRTIGSAGGLHAEVKIGSSMVMIGGYEKLEQESPATIYLYVESVDQTYKRALNAGAISMQEPTDQPYGDRVAYVKDAFGNSWYIASRIS
jgi:PhnB protein